ncbi:MAG: Fe-S cluster assembly protein SufB, partial [Melioribacteraceae bacterium]|nr:Fe-S cluster assembly protein SufB [Melioribacteraceae bacterium]
MSDEKKVLDEVTKSDYKWGFVSDIEAEDFPIGLNEDVIRMISAKKEEPEWMTEWRLKAFRHWQTMEEPNWAKV